MCCIQLATGAFGGFKVSLALVLLSMLLLLQLYLWLSYGRRSCEHPMPALPPQVCLAWKRGGPGPSLLTSHTSSGPLSVPRDLRRWG